MYKIGFDLGGTKLEGIILDDNNIEVDRKRIPISRDGYGGVLDNVEDLYTQLRDEIGNENHTVGLGTPGAMSLKYGVMKNCPNIPGMDGSPFQEDLKERLRRNIRVENDANCFALAETLIGAAKGEDWVFGIIMGTGCGGGIVHKGDIITGLQETASEWGHSTINHDATEEDGTGTKGAVESYISGSGLEARYEEVFGEHLKTEEIYSKYKEGEGKAGKIMEQFFDHFAIAVSNIITILDPNMIVLGGGLSNIDELYTIGVEKVKAQCYVANLETPIVKNKLGDSAGVFGAALLGV